MSRKLEPGENPFREINPANAQRRRELMEGSAKHSHLDEIERYMNERHARLQAERLAERD